MDQYFEEAIDNPPEVPDWLAALALILFLISLSL